MRTKKKYINKIFLNKKSFKKFKKKHKKIQKRQKKIF